ncbi:MAG: SDR family NAD(P)-dependent oxidoreductase [Pseudomonadota bacterium]
MQLKDRVALITGASRGIGRAVALAFAKEGAHVIAIAKSQGGLEDLDDDIQRIGGTTTLVPLNLNHSKKIDSLGPSLYERWEKLDIVIGNAGILSPLSPLAHTQDKDWQDSLNINLTANWHLIRTLDPLLRLSNAGRAIFVTSSAVKNNRAYWGSYSVAKAGLEALVKTYAQEIESTRVRVNLINPGATATRMRAQAYPGEDQNKLTQPEQLTDLFIKMAKPDFAENGIVVDYQDTI